jgi:hypothetical protein
MTFIVFATMVSSVLFGQLAPPSCHLSTASRERLTRLVSDTFALRPNTELKVSDRGLMHGFNRVTVFSVTPGDPFEKELYITSDGRFVVEPVGDLAENPAGAESRTLREILNRLREDDPPW